MSVLSFMESETYVYFYPTTNKTIVEECKQSFEISKYNRYNLAHESILARTVTAIFRMNSIYSPMEL